MPTMKVTPDAAMRARDVSRPHAEHLEWAEETEAHVTATADVAIEAKVVAATPAVEVDIPDSESSDSEDRTADPGRADAGRVDGSRRRRVRGVRSSSRRGRPSR
ncbi:MAG: hypothetical protein ACRDOU_06920 [Streptosporangiaceae bacterium]